MPPIASPFTRLVQDLAHAYAVLTSSFPSPTEHQNTDTLSSNLHRRQNQILSIPATYGGLDSSPAPGTVAGIVIGTVAGVVLLLWVIYTAFGLRGDSITVMEEVAESRRSGSRPRSRRTEEIVEVSASRPRSRRDDTIVVEEFATSQSDDVVEVVEEDESSVATSPPRRKRASGSYRRVDPYEYGGGNSPYRGARR